MNIGMVQVANPIPTPLMAFPITSAVYDLIILIAVEIITMAQLIMRTFRFPIFISNQANTAVIAAMNGDI